MIGSGPLTGGRSITVRESLLLPAAETRLEGGGGGNRSYVGLQMQIRGSRAQPETGGRLQEGRMIRNVLIIVYLVVGVVVANSHHYFVHLTTLKPVLSAVLAVPLWPLVMFG